ncbi:hypothetical protein AB0C22_30720 [Micromonospora sp. NPDC048894]|uniref:hypothetical protein n=1 Tax=Micromonospora sp. NPDC048894 TaxID=3155493 RepID=UPI003402609D
MSDLDVGKLPELAYDVATKTGHWVPQHGRPAEARFRWHVLTSQPVFDSSSYAAAPP